MSSSRYWKYKLCMFSCCVVLHKSCMYNFDSYKSLTCYMDNSTAQFKLYACVSVHTCVCMFMACKTFKNWFAHALLHTILACA